MVKFVDLEQDRDALEAERQLRPGVILFDEESGNWTAFRPSSGFSESGMGAPTRLEPGLWLSNMDFDRTRAFGRQKGAVMRHDGWLRMKMDRIVAAWLGEGQSLDKAAPLVGSVSDRVVRLVQEALAPHLRRLNLSDPGDVSSQLRRATSLATGIANLNSAAIRAGEGGEKTISEHFQRSYQWGMFITGRKAEEDDHLRLNFSFPKLTYAMTITSGRVPTGQGWKLARRDDNVSTQGFFDEILATGRPALFRASCSAAQSYVPEYADAFISPLNAGEDGARTRFIAEEIVALSEYYDMTIESAVCGNEWAESSTGLLLRELEEVAGGPEAARTSWSVALAADNILSAPFRKLRNSEPGDFAEPIWLPARDREAMLPAIRALYDVGAVLVSALQGTISVKCPRDPELLVSILDAAWEHGLTLPLDDVDLLDRLGVTLPTDHSGFGGIDVDYLFASLVHARRTRALYVLDSVQAHPRAARANEYRKVTG